MHVINVGFQYGLFTYSDTVSIHFHCSSYAAQFFITCKSTESVFPRVSRNIINYYLEFSLQTGPIK